MVTYTNDRDEAAQMMIEGARKGQNVSISKGTYRFRSVYRYKIESSEKAGSLPAIPDFQ